LKIRETLNPAYVKNNGELFHTLRTGQRRD